MPASSTARIPVRKTPSKVPAPPIEAIGAQRDLSEMIAEAQDYVHQTRADTFQQLTTQERLLSDMRGQATKNQLRHSLVELRAPQDSIVLSVVRGGKEQQITAKLVSR